MNRRFALAALSLMLLIGPCICCSVVTAQETATPAETAPAEAAAPETAAEAAPAEPSPPPAFLAGKYDTGSTTWIMVSAALVFFMMPGLALFYGGMCRSKNVLNMFMCVMVCAPLIAIEWVGWGYSMAFAVPSAISVPAGTNEDGSPKPAISYLGWDSNLVFFKSFSDVDDPAGPNGYGKLLYTGDTVGGIENGVPELMFAMFQMMFAIITPALIVGAIAERVKFSAWCIFVPLWATIVYNPVAHWVWNVNGWLFQKGVMDFAGGTVVHVLAGVSALALILVLPKRKGYPGALFLPHSVGWTLLGGALLMVGWFGFNAGSAIASGKDYMPVAASVAVMAFAATAIAGSAAAGSWMAAEWVVVGKPTALGFGSGMVAGLVVITPCAGHVTPAGALILGLIGGVGCFFAVQAKQIIKYDDSLDVVGVHGVGGALGALLLGFFAVRPVTGSFDQFILQATGVIASGIYAFVLTAILGIIIHKTVGFTVKETTEEEGLDLAEHGEVAYRLN